MTYRFEPDRDGLARLHVETDERTVPRLTDAIYDDSQTYVPVLTGDLKASGRKEVHGSTGFVVYGDDHGPVDYAVYQELGTSIMAAQPYLRPAAYKVRDL